MIRAVIFDLFETLITEQRNGYQTQDIGAPRCSSGASVLGVSEETFETAWVLRRPGRMKGHYPDYPSVIRDIADGLNLGVDETALHALNQQRLAAKQIPYRNVAPDILAMMDGLRTKGLKIGLISNCSHDEIDGLSTSELVSRLDDIVLSCKIGHAKPSPEIFRLACADLGIAPADCLYIGDGGAKELFGATEVGMHAIQATWYRTTDATINAAFTKVSSPMDILALL